MSSASARISPRPRREEPGDGPRLSGRAGLHPELATFGLSDGTVLAVRLAGPPTATATAVLVHGWTQDHTSWEDVTAELAGHLRVIAYDARGHGWSDAGPRGSETIDRFADDLAEVIAGIAPNGPVVLAGHSLGGPVIMAFAERHPHLVEQRVAGVAFVATSAAGLGRDIFGWSARLTAPLLLASPLVTRARRLSRGAVNFRYPNLLAVALRAGLYGPGAATKHNRRRTAAQVARSHPVTTAALVDEMTRHDRIHTLAGLEGTRTVVLAGTKDGLTPIAHSRAIADAMPHAELVVYPEAGHMLPYERPTEVAEQIVRLAG
ncbi:MAG TPA: alpha/beta hydrolase [Jatrophihabitans sp.]|jgi:pimeloyl-ACP methyl ester carboxylesterase|uniref:alpha/beta fold hydrolase n=1 Tax=Jatrophihabitans sp. TaxID=1932789 RepID=UPI002DFE543C|nr:alpha/beta hydrolase [Jatrophihabitans sp.]